MNAHVEYVVGFMFQDDKVALIRKVRPAWQAGKLNGIGGHIEAGERPVDAMIREFEEETGCPTYASEWKDFAELSGRGWTVYFFHMNGNLSRLRTTTDEEIVFLPVSKVTVENSMPNLTWLIPMAKSMSQDRCRYFEIQENYDVGK